MSDPGANVYLVWLEWPEKCFRVGAKALARLRELVPPGSRIRRVRSEAGFLRRLPEATHALVWSFRSEWFARAPRLRVLATPGAGRELVPTEGPAHVTIHFGGFHGRVMSETVLGLMLAWCRGLLPRATRPEPWPKTWLSERCYALGGTHAVILGYGRIGRAIGDRLAAQGVSVTGIRRKNLADLPRALRTADWLILALPGDTGTTGLVDAALLAKLPRRAVVVNVGRGNAIDEAALARALVGGRLAAALLDVHAREPQDGTGPLDRGVPHVFSLPHASAFYPEYLTDFLEELKACGLLK